jgi:hypothetical protein
MDFSTYSSHLFCWWFFPATVKGTFLLWLSARHLCSSLSITNKPPSFALISEPLISSNDFQVRTHTAGYWNSRLHFVSWHTTYFEFETKTRCIVKVIQESKVWGNEKIHSFDLTATKFLGKNVFLDLWNQPVKISAPKASIIIVFMQLKLLQSHFPWKVSKLFGAKLGLIWLPLI